MRWMLVSAAFLPALLLGACGPAGPMAPSHTEAESQVYTEALSRIVLTGIESGDVTVRASSGPAATVGRELHWRGEKRPEVTETVEGQTLRVSYQCQTANCSIDYDVRVPATVEVHAETTSGNVDIHGISGAVVIQTTSGDVSLDGVSGDITLKGTSGDVNSADLAARQVTTSTTSGDVALDFAAAPEAVSVRGTSGDLTITVPPGRPYAVQVRTTSGDHRVTIDQSASAEGRIDVESTSGDVTIGYGRARSGGTPSPSR